MPVDWWRTRHWHAMASGLLVMVGTAAFLVLMQGRSGPTQREIEGVAPPPGREEARVLADKLENTPASERDHAARAKGVSQTDPAAANKTMPLKRSNSRDSAVAQGSGADTRVTSTAAQSGLVEVNGTWRTTLLTDPSNPNTRYRISFDFVQRGDILLGTVTEALQDVPQPVTKRIMDGMILEKKLLFHVEKQASVNGKLLSYKESYVGVLNDTKNVIKFERSNDAPGTGDFETFAATRN